MKGIKSKIITTWRNYAIDKDKARYTKVGGSQIGTDLICFKGLEPGKKYTISAQVRLNIQQTNTNIFFEVNLGQNWLGVNRKDFAGMGDMSLNANITITPPRWRRRKFGIRTVFIVLEWKLELCSTRWRLLYRRKLHGERGRQAVTVYRPGFISVTSLRKEVAA